jgi:signal transduction histidine kinase
MERSKTRRQQGKATQISKADAEKQELIHALGERVKELTALYKVANLLNDEGTPLPILLRELASIFPPAWQYPEITAARITWGETQVATSNYAASPWVQRATLRTADGQRGELEVVYLEERPPDAEGPFLAEERSLIDSLAEMLRMALNRRLAVEALTRLNAELEERVAERTEALQVKTRELETFAHSVAHDLKAPLRGIDGYSRLLLEEHLDRLNDEGRTFLHNVRYSVTQMNQLIEDLLAYAQIERREFAVSSIQLRPCIEKWVEERKRELVERRIAIVLKLDDSTALADVSGLAQVLRNYLDNAIKFTRDRANPEIEVGVAEVGSKCRVWVRDNGIGFDMKHRDRIFDIFQRLHRAEDYPGTGIGLAIAQKAVERMGGSVWAESEPGQGSVFYLEIPRGVAPR